MTLDGRRLCIVQIFGPEGGNHPTTTDTIECLKRAAGKLGMPSARVYQMGGSQALARSEVLSAAYLLPPKPFTDFVYLDSDAWIAGGVGAHAIVLEQVLEASQYLSRPICLPYVTRLTPTDNAPAFALSFPEGRPHIITLPSGLRVAKLQGSGFGFVHMTREHIKRMREAYAREESFVSERPELAGAQCVHLFRETNARKAFDALDPSRPVRALPEDDSYWHRAGAIDQSGYVLVDVPLTHRGATADLMASLNAAGPARPDGPSLLVGVR